MHGKAKRWISHLNGESLSGELKGSREGGRTTDSCIAMGAGMAPDVFKKKKKEGQKAFFRLKLYQIPPSLAFVNLPAFLEIIFLWKM